MGKEVRVYVLESDDIDNLEVSFEEISDEEFSSIAEKQGRVYTLVGFQVAFNLGDVDSEGDAIRIIEVETTGDVPKKIDPDNEPIPMKEIYRVIHKRMKSSDNSDEIFDILQEIKFPEDYK